MNNEGIYTFDGTTKEGYVKVRALTKKEKDKIFKNQQKWTKKLIEVYGKFLNNQHKILIEEGE